MSRPKELTGRNRWWLKPWRMLVGRRGDLSSVGSDTSGADDTPLSRARTSDTSGPAQKIGSRAASLGSATEETGAKRSVVERLAARGSDRVGARESATQFGAERRTDDVIDLVMGFDFGTSCSKVVVRSGFAFRDRAVVVPWRGRDGASTYLLPTVLHEGGRGELDLAPLENGDVPHTDIKIYTDIKIQLLDSPSDNDARARAAAYLGHALRIARQWLLDTQKEAWGRYRIRWTLHVGIPSAGYDDKEVRETFYKVARAAWRLSLRQELPKKATAIDALRGVDRESDEIPVIEVVPEIAAEVVGYAWSRRRRDGLHVIVDVGASTIDICGFILRKRDKDDDDDRYELLTALVERIGVHELHLRRLRAIAEAGKVSSTAMTSPDPLGVIPDVGCDYVDHPAASLRERLNGIDADYDKECARALMSVLMALKKDRYPTWFRTASEPLPVFMAGGGRSFARIREAMKEANRRFETAVYTRGIDLKEIPSVETANELPAAMAGRLDVAYGLSFDRLDIGVITPPGEIEDIPSLPRREPRQVISKDQV